MVQWDQTRFGGLEVLGVGSNTGHDPRLGRTSTRGNGSQMPIPSPSLGGTVLAHMTLGKLDVKTRKKKNGVFRSKVCHMFTGYGGFYYVMF